MIAEPDKIDAMLEDEDSVLSFARIEWYVQASLCCNLSCNLLALLSSNSHYFIYGCWLDDPDYILKNVDKIRDIPGIIVQGRYDMVAPMKTAWELHEVSWLALVH